MIPLFKKISLALCLTGAVFALSGCGSSEPEETTVPPTLEPIVLPTAPKETEAAIDPALLEEHVTAVLEAGELYTLDYYPNLKTVDLSGSTCYSAILDFSSKRPHLDITFSVSLGETEVSSKATSTVLTPGSFDYETLLQNLQYLPELISISLSDVDLSAEQLQTLRETYLRVFEVLALTDVCSGVMCAENRLGLNAVSLNSPLLQGILREEWDFRGIIISDAANDLDYMHPREGLAYGTDMWCLTKKYAIDIRKHLLKDAHLINKLKESNKRSYFAYVNSNYINGLEKEVAVEDWTPWWQPVLIGINAVTALAFVLLLGMFLKSLRRERRQSA